jgi:hypothetical protein
VTTHPTTEELVTAVAGWIEELRPQLAARDAFLARVALNALATIGRELRDGPAVDVAAAERLAAVLGHPGSLDELERELCAAIRAGDMTIDTPGLLALLRQNVEGRLAIDQPGYRPDTG